MPSARQPPNDVLCHCVYAWFRADSNPAETTPPEPGVVGPTAVRWSWPSMKARNWENISCQGCAPGPEILITGLFTSAEAAFRVRVVWPMVDCTWEGWTTVVPFPAATVTPDLSIFTKKPLTFAVR